MIVLWIKDDLFPENKNTSRLFSCPAVCWIVHCLLSAVCCLLSTVYCLLTTVYCLLSLKPTSFGLLSTVYLLPSVYCLYTVCHLLSTVLMLTVYFLELLGQGYRCSHINIIKFWLTKFRRQNKIGVGSRKVEYDLQMIVLWIKDDLFPENKNTSRLFSCPAVCWIVHCLLSAVCCLLSTVYCLLTTVYCLLSLKPTSFGLLSTVYLLPSVYCLYTVCHLLSTVLMLTVYFLELLGQGYRCSHINIIKFWLTKFRRQNKIGVGSRFGI